MLLNLGKIPRYSLVVVNYKIDSFESAKEIIIKNYITETLECVYVPLYSNDNFCITVMSPSND